MKNKTFKLLAIIPAKKKSVGLKNKNLLKINGKSLVEIAINQALASKLVSSVAVTTDIASILDLAKLKNCRYIIKRKKNLTKNSSKMYDVVASVLNDSEVKSENYTHAVLLQVTSPLRRVKHLDESIQMFLKFSQSKSLISVRKSREIPWKMFVSDESNRKHLKLLFGKDKLNINRQMLPKAYCQNGAIYIFHIKSFLSDKSFFIKPCLAYEMDEFTSIDVDSMDDYKLAKKLSGNYIKS